MILATDPILIRSRANRELGRLVTGKQNSRVFSFLFVFLYEANIAWFRGIPSVRKRKIVGSFEYEGREASKGKEISEENYSFHVTKSCLLRRFSS